MNLKKSVAVSESGAIFDSSLGNTYNVNETGLMLINCVKEGMSRESILKKLTEEYEVDSDKAEGDLFDFLNMLKQYKLIND